MEKNIIGYRCIADCTLEYTNFEMEEEIIIEDHCEDTDWKGVLFYENHPYEFEPIYE
jgi:hypothetical protein